MSIIQINDQELVRKLEKVASGLERPRELTSALAVSLQTITEDNFDAGGRPKWAGLASGQPSRLYQSGTLRSRITTSFTQTEAMIGTNVEYAAIHQFGGHTRPHVIRPKTKQALAFGGKVFKQVNHPGSNIPARPFLPMDQNGTLQHEAERAIYDDVDHFYQKLFG